MKKSFLLIFISVLFLSCESEANIKVVSKNAIEVSFSSSCGPVFEKLIRNFTDTDESVTLFSKDSVYNGFTASGFQNVSVSTPDAVSIKINFIENGDTILSDSQLISRNENSVKINLSNKILADFYNSCDDEIKTYLDLLVAPVFNDETMSGDEYLELISSIYGNDCVPELENSFIKINISDLNGKKSSSKISLLKLLTLSETVNF